MANRLAATKKTTTKKAAPETNGKDKPGAKPIDIGIIEWKQHVLDAVIVGETSIMTNKFSQSAMDVMEKKQRQGKGGAADPDKKSSKEKELAPRIPAEVAKAAAHEIRDGNGKFIAYGIPASGIKEVMIATLYNCFGKKDGRAKEGDKIVKKDARTWIWIKGVQGLVPILDPDTLKPLPEGSYEVDTRPVKIPQTTTWTLAHRPRWDRWALQLHIEFDAERFTPKMITNMMYFAGIRLGLSTWSGLRNGEMGRYRLESLSQAKTVKFSPAAFAEEVK